MNIKAKSYCEIFHMHICRGVVSLSCIYRISFPASFLLSLKIDMRKFVKFFTYNINKKIEWDKLIPHSIKI